MAFFKSLRGVRVLDFSRLIPGPFGTRILRDFGASVTKIEIKGREDSIADFPPYAFAGVSVLDASLNRDKKRLRADLSRPRDFAKLRVLVRDADVLVESFRPGVMRSLGLGYAALKRINPKLVYVSVTGYGQSGKLSGHAGHDLNFVAAAGVLGASLGVPGFQLADFVGGGLFAATAVCAALFERERTGKGRHLDVAMARNLVYLHQHDFLSDAALPLEAIRGASARYNLYRARDGRVVALGALEDKFWRRFCDAVTRPDWAGVPLGSRADAALKKKVAALFASKPAAHWRGIAESADCCLTVAAAAGDLSARGWLESVTLRRGGEKRTFRVPGGIL